MGSEPNQESVIEPMKSDVFLSLACIVGDGGVGTLGRMLESVFLRDGGPLVDEVILCWNGKDDALLEDQLRQDKGFLQKEIGSTYTVMGGHVPIKVVRQLWENDFAKARNESFSHTKGQWVLWLDSDDTVASASTPEGLAAIEAVERTYGIKPAGGEGSHMAVATLKEWLKNLPWNVTCVRAPYDYGIDPVTGYVTVRQTRRRILRRGCYAWRMPIHELAYPIPGLVESAVDNLGLLPRHFPGQAGDARVARNTEILTKLTERTGTPDNPTDRMNFADARHAYDVAAMHISAGNLAQADESIRAAISRGGDNQDIYRYRLTRSQINISRGLHETALAEALASIGLMPDWQDAFFMAAECHVLMGNWRACIEFYNLGVSKTPRPQAVDFVVSRELKPMAQTAVAYCELGEPEKALDLAREATRRYPNDQLSHMSLERAQKDLNKKKSIDGILTAVEVLTSKRELRQASQILWGAEKSIVLRGITALPRFQQAAAVVAAGLEAFAGRDFYKGDPLPQEVRPLQEEAAKENAGVIFYDTNRTPEDVESIVDGWEFRAREITEAHGGYQVLKVAAYPSGFAAKVRRTSKPPITFYSPCAFQLWSPYFPEIRGMGGSESSVVYLAQTLAKRGYPVTFYCPSDEHIGCDMGFVWRSMSQFNVRKLRCTLVACRAPWIMRNPDLKVPTYIWHQDNGYGSDWQWCNLIHDRSAGSFHVSEWAKRGLIKELGHDDGRHHVIGNGVREDWCFVTRENLPARNPHRVIYASDATRGLDTLLNCWPFVVAQVPDAELHIYGSLETSAGYAMLAVHNSTAVALEMSRVYGKINSTKNVFFHGRVGQRELTEEMFKSGVYAYPGGPMPEGYGVALAQAAAAGLEVVFPDAGALPDIHLKDFMGGPVKTEEGARAFLDTLIRAVKSEPTEARRKLISYRMLETHSWERVADRFEEILNKNSNSQGRAA